MTEIWVESARDSSTACVTFAKPAVALFCRSRPSHGATRTGAGLLQVLDNIERLGVRTGHHAGVDSNWCVAKWLDDIKYGSTVIDTLAAAGRPCCADWVQPAVPLCKSFP